ncbi:MAG: GNAT family N-acetyltransferase, partial [Dehalococcoidia bacterium]
MTSDRLLDAVTPWLERRLGAPLSALGRDPTPVLPPREDGVQRASLRALRLGDRGVVVARPEWVEPLRVRVSDLALDQLFTVFGAYEMARVTLPDEIAVWEPNWNIFADAESLRPAEDPRPRRLGEDDFARVDFNVFWHCESAHPAAGFGVYEEDQLLALATATDEGDPVMEIGVDVAPGAQGRGLGRAVISAAGRWIVAQ